MSARDSIQSLLGQHGRALINIGSWSLVAKACAAANLFLTIPFALQALDAPLFGAWATLTSLVAFAGFLDLGLSNGTLNLMAAAHGRGSDAEAAMIHRESQRLLGVIALLLACVLLGPLLLAPWQRLLGLTEDLADTSTAAVAIVMAAVVASVPLNLAHKAQLALGRGDRAFKWQAVGQLVTLAFVIAVALWHPTLPALTAAAVFTPLLAALASTLDLHRAPLRRESSRTVQPPRTAIRLNIRREGTLFFVLQLSAALAFSADLLLISSIRGASEAGAYAVVQRLFSVIPLALSLAWAPLWPIYRKSLASGEHAWVARTLRRSMLGAALFAAACSTAILLGYTPLMQNLALDHQASWLLLAGFAAWSVLEAISTGLATFLNSASVLRFQVICSSSFALTCIGAKAWVLIHYDSSLMPWMNVAAYCATCVLPLLYHWPGIWRHATTRRY